jgi:hypothetical protein
MLASVGTHIRRHVVGYIALFFALGGTAYASIPDAGGAVHVCYDTTAPLNGAYPLYVIDTASNAACPQGRAGPMTGISLAQPAPQSPQGSQRQLSAVPGPLGAGPHSVAVGPKGKEVSVGKQTPFSTTTEKSLTVHCPNSHPVALWGYYEAVWTSDPFGNPGDYNGLGGLVDWANFQVAIPAVHSLRVIGKPEGWTTLWSEKPNFNLNWAGRLSVNCATDSRATGLHVGFK